MEFSNTTVLISLVALSGVFGLGYYFGKPITPEICTDLNCSQILLSKNSIISEQEETISRMFKSLRNMSERCDFQAAEIKMLESIDMDAAVTLISQTI